MSYAALKEPYYHIAARNLFLNQEFFKILDFFSEKNISLIPLKGIALIQRIYPDLGERHIGDMDLLIRYQDVPRTTQLLQGLGYTSASSYFNPQRPYSIYLNALTFNKPGQIPYFIHLHWHLLNSTRPLFMYRIDMQKVWQRAKLENCPGKVILMLAPEHLIVYLSIHALKHAFNKVSLFSDLKKASEFYQDRLDWPEVREIARAWGAESALYYSLYLTFKILKADFLKDILNIIKPKKITKRGYRIISSISEERLGTHNLTYPLYLDMIEGLVRRLKFIFLGLFLPPRQLCHIHSVGSKYLVPYHYLKWLSQRLINFARRQIGISRFLTCIE